MERYERNMLTFTKEENDKFKDSKVCVVGCGGIGGYVIEMLARLGIGTITAVDGDVFQESNLNRQILSDELSIGMSKAKKAEERIKTVNSTVKVNSICEFLTVENGSSIISGNQIVVDALDNVKSRFLLQQICEDLNIPLVHGAIGGWFGQVTTIFPGDRTLNFLYTDLNNSGLEKELGTPSFTPAIIASIQSVETAKVLISRGDLLRKKILLVNLLEQKYEIIDVEK